MRATILSRVYFFARGASPLIIRSDAASAMVAESTLSSH
jgi:hypothetical protein